MCWPSSRAGLSHPHLPSSRPSDIPHSRCKVESISSRPLLSGNSTLPSGTPAAPLVFFSPPCLAGVAKLCLPPPRAREGTVGAEREPQCSVHWCIMTPFMGWVENLVGKQWNYFYENGSPHGQGLGTLAHK